MWSHTYLLQLCFFHCVMILQFILQVTRNREPNCWQFIQQLPRHFRQNHKWGKSVGFILWGPWIVRAKFHGNQWIKTEDGERRLISYCIVYILGQISTCMCGILRMLKMIYSHVQAHSSSLTSSSLWPVAFLCSYWKQHWASTPVREESCAGGRSAPCLKVRLTEQVKKEILHAMQC